ncbi:hypothetical protein PLESTF_001856800 [Pleodorina starrii]|nr:hypothetical protein PLESTF_001856800 [Pleodorina starrii]
MGAGHSSLDVSSMDALLRVRRLATYLQIEGCTEACDATMAGLASSSSAAAGPDNNNNNPKPLAGILDLYMRRGLLPEDPEGENAALKLLNVCRQQLVQHSGSVPAEGPLVEGGPCLGELLAWAFRDAQTLLSDPETRRQMEALPLAAMEALLRCDAFAADNEASVLLVVACWLAAFGKTSSDTADARSRLCKLVRLSQLSSTFLHVVLPCLTWFPITPEEYRFLCDYATAPPAQRTRMIRMAAGLYDCGLAWYATTPRPCLPQQAVRLYEWSIQEKDLAAALSKDAAAQMVRVDGRFANGAERVVSYGLEWYPYLQYGKGKDAAGVFLACVWPAALGVQQPEKVVAVVQPGPVVFRVDKGCASELRRGAEVAWKMTFAPEVYVRVGWEWGEAEALPLQAVAAPPATAGEGSAQKAAAEQQQGGAAAGPSPLSPWAPYLLDGCIRGSLLWTW